jgi:hypothetical protein
VLGTVIGGFAFVVLSLLPILVGFTLIWWLVTTLNSINRNTADIARYLGRQQGERDAANRR